MLGRIRFLKRLSSLEIPLACLPPASSNLCAGRNLSSLFPPPTAKSGSKGRGVLLLFHCLKKRREGGFCTRATEMEEARNASLFSPYLSVRIQCKKDVAVIYSEALLCFGASSASMDELSTCEGLDEIWITSIIADGQDVHTCISHAADSIGLNYIPNYEVSVGEECDWVTKESFHPVEVTEGLWIIPKWRSSPDLQAINIILDPGMAFGTGEHPTTKLCLLLLHGLIKGGEHFLDYGTGSGVLGIAAVKMGAALSVGIDIDSQAVSSSRQNIALNEFDSGEMSVYLVHNKLRLLPSDENNQEEQTSDSLELIAAMGKFDIVVANILLNPLMDLVEDIVAFGKPGAIIGVSGILSEQVQQIEDLYSRYLDDISLSELDGWACLHGTRKKI